MGKVLKLRETIEGYRLFCRAEGRSRKSIRWYMHKLRIFEKYLQSQGFPLEVGKITTEHLREFLVHLRESVKADELNPHKPAASRPLSPHTIREYAQALKAFFSWAIQEGLIEENPAKHLLSPKAPKTVVPTFSEAQVKRLLSVTDRKSPIGFRDYCIILTFLDTGIRLSELVSLQMGQLDLEEGHFQVRGKGNKERVVPMGVSLQKCLWKYMHRYRPEPDNPAVGNPFLNEPATLPADFGSGKPPQQGTPPSSVRTPAFQLLSRSYHGLFLSAALHRIVPWARSHSLFDFWAEKG